jgi:capsular polysaccharide biosynthesis protein
LNDLNFLIPHPLNADLVIATTRSYNIPFIFIRENEIFYVKNLVVVPEIAPTGNYRSQLMRNIREPYIKGGFKNESKRIYITRSKALKRKIINEAELIPLLKKYDFNIISMEDLTFEEQFKLVIGAEVLVSLHGAGLTHMLWLATDAKVMEIRLKGDGVNNCYFSLASDLKINYYYCLADKVDKNAPTQLTDFYISPCEFQKSLDKLFRDG